MILKAKKIRKSYSTSSELLEILKGLDFEVNKGEMISISGPSGCGKSTLVNLIAGFDKPDVGEITINGKQITEPGNDRMVVFQETALIPWQTTMDNVTFGPILRGRDKNEVTEEANRLLEKVGLKVYQVGKNEHTQKQKHYFQE